MLFGCLCWLLAACQDSANASPKRDDTAAVYSAILGKLVADEPPTTTTTRSPERAATTTAPGASTSAPDGTDTTDGGADEDDTGAAGSVAEEPEPEPELPTLFVEPLGDGYVIDLKVQAKVVKNLEAIAEVRFIDDRMEAVQADEPGQPVRPNGMLVALGPLVQGSEVERTVQVRRYVDERNHVDRLATVTASGGSWTVVLRAAR